MERNGCPCGSFCSAFKNVYRGQAYELEVSAQLSPPSDRDSTRAAERAPAAPLVMSAAGRARSAGGRRDRAGRGARVASAQLALLRPHHRHAVAGLVPRDEGPLLHATSPAGANGPGCLDGRRRRPLGRPFRGHSRPQPNLTWGQFASRPHCYNRRALWICLPVSTQPSDTPSKP